MELFCLCNAMQPSATMSNKVTYGISDNVLDHRQWNEVILISCNQVQLWCIS